MTRAFTILELLVVIIILVMLMLLLTPTIDRAIDQNHMITCGSNLREIMKATTTHAGDHEGHLPGPGWRKTSATKGKEHSWLYYDRKMDYRRDLKGGTLWPYLGVYEIYRCPADYQPDEDDPHSVPKRQIAGGCGNTRMMTSYCENGSVVAYGDRTCDIIRDDEGLKRAYWRTYRITQFKVNDIIFWEPDETKSGGWWWDGSNFPWEGITHRHFDRASIGRVDGGVEWLLLDEYYKIGTGNWKARRPNIKNRIWNTPDSDLNKSDGDKGRRAVPYLRGH